MLLMIGIHRVHDRLENLFAHLFRWRIRHAGALFLLHRAEIRHVVHRRVNGVVA